METGKETGTLGIIAGGGPLPLAVADAALSMGRAVFIVGLEDNADQGIAAYPHGWARIGAIGKCLSLLKNAGCTEVTMVGPVKRPDLRKIVPDALGFKLLPRFVKLLAQGDDGLLRGVVDLLEKEHGLKVIAPHEVARDLLAPEGVLTRRTPGTDDQGDIRAAVRAAHAIGLLDIGQGAVACRGVVIALEAIEGTDMMLDRVGSLAPRLRGTVEARAGVLVKLPKPGQERRVDLPAIGVQTVERAAAAGLAGIAVEAGGALVGDAEVLARRANALGLFVVGLSHEQVEAMLK